MYVAKRDHTHLVLCPHLQHGVDEVGGIHVGGVSRMKWVCLGDGGGQVAVKLQQQVDLQLQEHESVADATHVTIVI